MKNPFLGASLGANLSPMLGKFEGSLTIDLLDDGRGNLNVRHNFPNGDGKDGLTQGQQGIYMAAAVNVIKKLESSGVRNVLGSIDFHRETWPHVAGEMTIYGTFIGRITIKMYDDDGRLECWPLYPNGDGANGITDAQKRVYLSAIKDLYTTVERMGPGKLIALVGPTNAPLPRRHDL